MKHDIIAVTITDPREIDLPDMGIIKLHDAEESRDLLIDTGAAKLREKFNADALLRRKTRELMFRSVNVDSIDILTDRPYSKELVKFFRMRQTRLG